MITGRPYIKDVVDVFEGCELLELRARDADIQVFVKGQIQKDNDLRKKVKSDAVLDRRVVDAVVQKAKGMYNPTGSISDPG
jgi:hypothetical protein